MCFKIFDSMEVGFLALALLAGAQVCSAQMVVAVNTETGSRPFDASMLASTQSTAANSVATTSLVATYPPALTAYSAPIYAANAPASGHTSISAVPEVGSWTVIIAALGLVGMRLWRSGKKNLSAIK